jgi:ribosome maturation factor RimP
MGRPGKQNEWFREDQEIVSVQGIGWLAGVRGRIPCASGAPGLSCPTAIFLLNYGFWLPVLVQSGVAHSFFWRIHKLTRLEGPLERVRSVALRVTSARGFELVDVEMSRGRGTHLVRLFVDRPGGISLDDLQSVSEEVSPILDALDPVPGSYTLEVSSPGLDRPLKTEADYRRFVGRLARVSSYEPIDGRRHWTGRIVSCEEGVVALSLEQQGEAARVPFAKISHGRLEVEFPGKPLTRD